MILALLTLLAACPRPALGVPVYDPAGSDPEGVPSGAAASTVDPRITFGFGSEKLVLPECSRARGGRRCHRTEIRSFADRPAIRTVPCCHKVLVGGQLTDPDGEPLSNREVDVIETFARGARSPSRVIPTVTDRRGFFRAWLEPGPSRRIIADFAGAGGAYASAIGRRLRLRVRAAVQMKASTSRVRVGGAPVVFTGWIAHPGARIPPTGLFVELEFRLPGMAWEQFRIVQTRSGRFRYPYTFEDDDSAGVRFLFRAFVPATGNWSYAPAASQQRAVTG